MSRRVALIGAGDLGLSLARYLKQSPDSYQLTGYFDDTRSVGEQILDVPVLGGLETIEAIHQAGTIDGVITAIGYKHLDFRAALFDRLQAADIPPVTFIHPSCYVDPTAKIGCGAILFPGCLIDAGVHVGAHCLLNSGCVIAHDSHIGAHSFLGPAVKLAGFVTVGEKSFLGIGTTIIDHCDLGNYCQTAGGAVVTQSFPGKVLLAGVPATIKKSIHSEESP